MSTNEIKETVENTSQLIETVYQAVKEKFNLIIIITPKCISEILEPLSELAYKNKSIYFLYVMRSDPEMKPFLQKMRVLGNIDFMEEASEKILKKFRNKRIKTILLH